MYFGHSSQSDGGHALTQLLLATIRLNGPLLRAGDALGRDLGLSNARWQVIAAVRAAPLTAAQIARDMGLRRQGVQPTINALARDGLVELRRNPNHQRARLVALTDAGVATLDTLMERQATWVNELAAGLSLGELGQATSLVELLRQLLVNREHRGTPGSGPP